jgi:hypothetical protein
VQKRAAELLHIKPTTLNEMIKRYDIRSAAEAGRRTRDRPKKMEKCPRPCRQEGE